MKEKISNGKKAFLVIHGIGEQNPLETLDSFARGLINHLRFTLDKIAFFFMDHTKKDQWIRRKIIECLHSFKARPFNFDKAPYKLTNTISHKLDGIPWINYYNENDPISGYLDFYKITEDDNARIDLPGPWGIAHVQYWDCPGFYKDIARRFL